MWSVVSVAKAVSFFQVSEILHLPVIIVFAFIVNESTHCIVGTQANTINRLTVIHIYCIRHSKIQTVMSIIDDTNLLFDYQGGLWSLVPSTSCYNSTLHVSTDAGASLAFGPFTGQSSD